MSGEQAVIAKNKKTPMQWLRSGKGQRATVIVTFLFIPLLLLIVFTYIPLAGMIQYSFFKMSYTSDRIFVGLDNYKQVFTDQDLFMSLKNSLYYMLGSVLQLGLALYFASVLSFKTIGGNFFKGALFFPYLVNGIAIGFIFKFFYTRGMVLDTVLTTLGFSQDSLPFWLRDKSVNNYSLAASSVWRYMGQNMVLFIGAIMSVDTEMYEAASLDGANKWHQFRYIILPSIKTIVVLNVILSITGSLTAFEQPYVILNGANGTATYFVKMNTVAHTNYQIGLASAMAIVLLLIIMVCTILQNLFFKYVWKSEADVDSKRTKLEKKYREKEAQLNGTASKSAI